MPDSTDPQSPHEHVFTGEWLADGCTCHEFREGYAGILVGHWNGWAIFTVTAPVMRAIVSNHQHVVLGLIAERTARGETAEDAWIHTQADLAAIYWLGDLVIVDSRTHSQDPDNIEIVTPDPDGRYQVGFSWIWEPVDPRHVHTIHTGQTSTPESTNPTSKDSR